MREPVIVVHGGAGTLSEVRGDVAAQARLRDGLYAAVEMAQRLLSRGGGAVDAVEAAVCVLEDCATFNAGRGSVLNSAGEVEMDAAIMCGGRGVAGAVAAVRTVVHPISAARAVMERTPHALLVGAAADAFAAASGLATAERDYFLTEERRAQLRRVRGGSAPEGGTVGAVAIDGAGHLAAATSTGGMTNKAPGRVGDSPIIGAGTWAADGRCAVSCTGSGESILRACLAHEIDAGMRLASFGLEAAVRRACAPLVAAGAEIGVIAVAAGGVCAMPFFTAAMPRGVGRGEARPQVAIFADE